MPDPAEILRELALLEGVQGRLATIASRTDDQRRHELIALRRELSLQIAQVGRVADAIFAATDAETAREYRTRFSRMRSAAAMHQANWPAVRLGEAVDEYRKSALAVREANRDFVAWTREALAALS